MYQLLEWQPDRLVAAGGALAGRAATLQRVDGDLVSIRAGLGGAWTGQAASAAAEHTARRAQEVAQLVEVVHGCALVLLRAGDALGRARADLQSAVSAAVAAGGSVAASGQVTPPVLPPQPPGLTDPQRATWQHERDATDSANAAAAARLSRQVDAALDAAGAADGTAEDALARLVPPVVSAPPQLLGGLLGGLLLGLLGGLFGGPDLAARSAALQRALAGGPLPADSASLTLLLDAARESGLPPSAYSTILKSYYEALALEHAGIDPAAWQTGLGVGANRAIVLKVYEYYRALYQRDPTLEWAGLANLVGPGFAAGFLDLGSLRAVARALEHLPGPVPDWLVPLLPGGLPIAGITALAHASDAQLRFYETTFLAMQKKIFLNIGAMHEAYLSGPDGMANLREMAAAGLIDAKTMAAWQNVDEGRRTGSAAKLHAGALGLADHEQNVVIANDWDAMRKHDGPLGEGVTYLMTVVGKPSVPGAHFPGQVDPLTVKAPLVGPLGLPGTLPHILGPTYVTVQTPLPDINVSVRTERWSYFRADTMPAYQHLLDTPQGRAAIQAEMSRPLTERIDDQRLDHRWQEILEQLDAKHWHVKVGR